MTPHLRIYSDVLQWTYLTQAEKGDKKMEKLGKCDYGKAAGLFEGADHGIPLIYSVLEGKGTGSMWNGVLRKAFL